jgi:ketosteroid isomerase-like protein
MKKLLGVLVLASSCVAVPATWADAPTPAPTDERTEVETLKRLGQEMGDAMIARDIAALDRIFSDDWKSLGSTGRVVTKDSVLEKFKNGTDTLASFELGPMDVLVLGNIAAVRGTVTEKRQRDGKDVSGDYMYMDLLEKREGTWVVVRSTGKRLK